MSMFLKSRLWKTFLRSAFAFAMLMSAPVITAAQQSIDNPLTARSFPCLVQAISLAAIEVAIPLAIITIIFAGLRFIFAAVSGKAEGITAARKMLLWAVIGTAIVVGSFAIAGAAVQIFGGPGQSQCSA